MRSTVHREANTPALNSSGEPSTAGGAQAVQSAYSTSSTSPHIKNARRTLTVDGRLCDRSFVTAKAPLASATFFGPDRTEGHILHSQYSSGGHMRQTAAVDVFLPLRTMARHSRAPRGGQLGLPIQGENLMRHYVGREDCLVNAQDHFMLTVFFKHDQSRPLKDIAGQLEDTGFWKAFPPEGIEVVSWYVMMGIGHVVTVNVPASRLREVNLAIEKTAWGAFRTEFYPTYDFTSGWQERRAKALEEDPEP